jgi:uncharacterized membrane protein YciS (DUF1049 family)
MRFLLIVVVLALVLAIVGFTATNIETLTTVTLWQTTYRDVPLWSVVFLSALAGVVSVGIIGVVDGALVRLRNRQMSRELHRLETELNFLRTQPPPARREPDLPGGPELPDDEAVAVEAADAKAALASAPVYHADDADDDDPYTGGRAV